MTSLRHSTDIGPPLACRRYRKHRAVPPRQCAYGLQSLNETFGGWSGGANVAGAPEFMSTLSFDLGRGFVVGPLGQLGALDFRRCQRYICDMRSPKKKPTAAKLRNWRVSILRNRAEYLGIVQAADEGAAEKAAIKAFALDEDGASGSRCERIEWRPVFISDTARLEAADGAASLRPPRPQGAVSAGYVD